VLKPKSRQDAGVTRFMTNWTFRPNAEGSIRTAAFLAAFRGKGRWCAQAEDRQDVGDTIFMMPVRRDYRARGALMGGFAYHLHFPAFRRTSIVYPFIDSGFVSA